MLALLVCISARAEPREVEIYMAEAAPLTMISGVRHGLIGDVAFAVLERAGYRAVVRNAPLLRAQKRVMEGRNVLITPLSRTPERESRFTWAVNVLPLQRAFFTLDEPVTSLEAAKRYRVIAVGTGTAQVEILRANGFREDQLHSLRLGESPVQLLRIGRVDAWFTTIPEGRHDWDGGPALRMSPPLAATDMYIGCSLDCDPVLVQALRKAIESMRADGSLQRMIEVYLPPPP
ncbi:hypothetical protein A9179_10860 [Pseudomonas alcaligenes]|uniref:Solute-binding protein family 3/N-terminal domain-containing protein n=1 Tax=Aquipseudomonas alcaligenes TaxID=43263 RepID=A0ABR7S174_AQUAC|nr:transporter substrate-binding domain-containing protein [Pseudomonas alcaligenes]MBC9250777.1 hypothetical protein [Pseudomonas alcaligenes]